MADPLAQPGEIKPLGYLSPANSEN